jgi:endonuclease V-like protein UPF0215 family
MRVVGVEDGGFTRQLNRLGSQETLLVCTVFEGLRFSECLLEKITVDGLDATEKLARLLRKTIFDVVMLAGVSFAGFNVIDATTIFDKFNKPVIIISRTKPNNLAVKNALLKHFKDWTMRWQIFEKLGPIYEISTKPFVGFLYAEVVGAEVKWVERLVEALTICGKMPEPLRVARLVARGLTKNHRPLRKANGCDF